METTSRTCRWVSRRLPLLASGDLVGTERRRVERHLIGCIRCRSLQTATQQSLAVLQEVAILGRQGDRSRSDANPPSLWPALARQIREAKHRPERPSLGDWVRSWTLSPAAGWVGASLVGSLILGSAWFWNRDQAAATQPALPATAVRTNTQAAPFPVADPSTLVADNDQMFRLLNEFDPPLARLGRPPAALPDGSAPLESLPGKRAGTDPFDPPLSLRLDYDLEWGTPSGSALNTQRAY